MSNRTKRQTPLRAQQRSSTPPRPSAAAGPDRRTGLIVGGAALALVVVLIAVLFAAGGDDTDTTATDISFNGVQLPAFTGPTNDAAVGMKAPLFVTTTLDGERAVVGGGGGPSDTAKVILFAAHWCPTCQAEIPEVAEYLAANPLPEGVEFIAVSTFPDSGRGNYPPDAWFDAVDWPYPVMADTRAGEIAQMYGMGSVPSWVVIDDQNFVLARTSGALGPRGVDQLVQLAAG